MRTRRLRKQPAALEISAFLNLIVVLVPFLLSTAVFTRLSVLDLKLPAQSGGVEQLKVNNLQLEVVIRKDSLDVGDRLGGLIQKIPNTAAGHDLKALNTLMLQVKQKFPTQSDATVLAESNTPYDSLVQVMDAMRSGRVAQDGKAVKVDLFTAISIGDAPQSVPAPAPAPAR